MPQATVPAARLAVIGGSATQGGEFPGTERPDVAPLDDGLVFETPYGDSPPFGLFTLAGETVLHVRMHGWRPAYRVAWPRDKCSASCTAPACAASCPRPASAA